MTRTEAHRRVGCALALLALGLSGSCGGSDPHPARPNLVLILTDDQRYDTLSCNGGKLVETPNLDRLASEGALFRRAYVVTSLCCPARASLYTSLYAHKTGIRNNEDRAAFLLEHRDLGSELQAAGYETAFFGKWHIPNPGAKRQPGFDHWMSFEGQGQYWDETYTVGDERRVIEGFNTDVLFDSAIEWVRRPREKPFLIVLSLKNLHRPFHLPDRHDLGDLRATPSLPESASDPVDGLPAFVQRVRTTLRNSWFDDGTIPEENIAAYHLMVLSVDDNVGRLTRALEERELLDRTAIALTSDGGFMWGEHGMYRKRTAYEPSIHIPLLLRFPATVPRGTQVDRLALNIDLAPTLLSLAGVEPPAEWQGRDLSPLWRDDSPDWREDFLYIDGWGKYVDGPQEIAVCGERYKYVRYRRGEIEEALFDLETDPDERINLATKPEHAARIADLRERCRASIAEIEAPESWMDPTNPGSAKDD